ncbi:MAG: hypothetical protein R2991_04475 [Thermoanaerobaculia bacterium]
MAASRGRLLLLLGPFVVACASGGAPKAEPVQPVEPASVQEPLSPDGAPGETAAPEEEEPAAPSPGEVTPGESAVEEESEPDAATPPRKATDVVVISEGKAPEAPVGLYEAAQEARRERGEAAQRRGPIVVTNETLRQHEPGGRISFGTTQESVPAATAPPAAAPTTGSAPAATAAAEPGGDPEGTAVTQAATPAPEPVLEERNPELYWRNRIREARLRWREAVETVDELEGLAEQLRYDFYATDDPWLRDSSIKPAWDRTLVDLEEAREDVDFQKRTVEAILAEGHRAGALPGWLREGLELEPDETAPRHSDNLDELAPIEPVEVEEGDPDGGRRP